MGKDGITSNSEAPATQPTVEELQEQLKAKSKALKDTQAAYTKGQQKLAQYEKQNDALKVHVAFNENSLDEATRNELNDLKVKDPDAWYEKKQELEREHLNKINDSINTAGQEGSKEFELSRREDVLAKFNQANPDIQLNDDVIRMDIPPRITGKLDSGEITFEQFLDECKDYLNSGTKIATSSNEGEPDLSQVSGGHTPSDEAQDSQFDVDYAKSTY